MKGTSYNFEPLYFAQHSWLAHILKVTVKNTLISTSFCKGIKRATYMKISSAGCL